MNPELSILRRLGMTLERDEAGTARPMPSREPRAESRELKTTLPIRPASSSGDGDGSSRCRTLAEHNAFPKGRWT
mgnify:FL=1